MLKEEEFDEPVVRFRLPPFPFSLNKEGEPEEVGEGNKSLLAWNNSQVHTNRFQWQ